MLRLRHASCSSVAGCHAAGTVPRDKGGQPDFRVFSQLAWDSCEASAGRMSDTHVAGPEEMERIAFSRMTVPGAHIPRSAS